MKNFFEHQDQARRTTFYLVFLFVCAISTTILALYASCLYALAEARIVPFKLWQPGLLIGIAIATCAVIGIGSFCKMGELSRDVEGVATGMGGQLAPQGTSDPQVRELLNVVEEMAIAAGVAVPAVYILPEPGINAFAAGFSANSAIVGVTRGTLQQLHRNELQGVIGHEFSHIVNGDMVISLKLMGLTHGLLCIYLVGRRLLFEGSRGRSHSDKKSPLVGIGIAAMIIGLIGYVFGQLIKQAISRQREYLADASAVQFTRDPDGITDALRRIAQQSAQHSRIKSAQAESASHLFFNDISLLGSLTNAFSTHPPLEERIRRLGGGSETLAPDKQSLAKASASRAQSQKPQRSQNPLDLITQSIPIMGLAEGAAAAFPGTLSSAATTTAATTAAVAASAQLAPDAVVANIGTVTPAHLSQAHSILSHLPTGLIEAVRSQPGAVAVVYGLLLDADSEVRSRQKKIILDSSRTVYELLEGLESLLEQTPVRSRLPLIELCVPTLKQLKPQVAAQFFTRIKALVRADGKLSLSEFALQTVLQYRLAPHFRPEQPSAPIAQTQLTSIWPATLTVVAALAKAGHTDRTQVEYAFREGLQQLPKSVRKEIPSSLPKSSLHDVGKALSQLRRIPPKLKQSVAEACAHTVLADSHTTDAEAELLRAILISLGCPVPPFLDALPRAGTSAAKQAA